MSEVMSTPGQPFVATAAENFSIDEKRKFYFVIFIGGNSIQPSISSEFHEFPQIFTYSFCLHFGCICLGLPFFYEKRIFLVCDFEGRNSIQSSISSEFHEFSHFSINLFCIQFGWICLIFMLFHVFPTL